MEIVRTKDVNNPSPIEQLLGVSTLPPGVTSRFYIRQASGNGVIFDVKGGSVGYPAENTTNSSARIELLDVNGIPTSVLADATHVRQYRGQGGTVLFDRSTGRVVSYRTRQGRETSFTGTGNLHIVYADETERVMKQVRTGAGLLTITPDTERKYTVRVYPPGQYSTTFDAVTNEYPLVPGAVVRRTATVEALEDEISPVSGDPIRKVKITVDQDGREYVYDYRNTTAAGLSVWSMTRTVDGVATTTEIHSVTFTGEGRQTIHTVHRDISPGGDEEDCESVNHPQ